MTANHTHRRAMRTVTPMSRAGRAGAGAAMAAAMLFGGASAATAEPQADAPQADVTQADSSSAVAGTAVTPVGIPAAEVAEDEDVEPSLAPAPEVGTISIEVGPTEEEIAAAEAAAEAERQAAEEAAAQEAAEQEAASSSQSTETRQDDSSSRSEERSSSSDSSESQESSSSSESSQESAPAPSAAKGSSILATARSGIGTPYVYGGTSPSGWDCSGFVQWVYAQHGISLPRGAAAQAAAGTVIPRSEARPGDLVYKPGHIGIYAGGNQFVDAGNSRVDTSERNIYSGSWTFIRIG
ncbi:C40 family peptidase [Brachybacterium saurashtrense]|nr:C40 family peptidase [Brachybacterium saurashtrense]